MTPDELLSKYADWMDYIRREETPERQKHGEAPRPISPPSPEVGAFHTFLDAHIVPEENLAESLKTEQTWTLEKRDDRAMAAVYSRGDRYRLIGDVLHVLYDLPADAELPGQD